jgi:hypothetical protein
VVPSGICCHSDQQNKNPFIDLAEELKNSTKSCEKRYRRLANPAHPDAERNTDMKQCYSFPKTGFISHKCLDDF